MQLHAKRWITALIAGPLVILLIAFGSEFYFALFIALLIAASAIEYGIMSLGVEAKWDIAVGILISQLIVWSSFSGGFQYLTGAVSASLIICMIYSLFRTSSSTIDISPLAKLIFGFVAIPLLLTHIIMIRSISGYHWIFLLFIIAVSGDVAAFYIGRNFGRRKLMPAISPGKTREGAIASIIGSLLGAIIYKMFLMTDISFFHIMILGSVTNILGQLGDLSESMIKRSGGIKDSGILFPGHGGVLDRMDFFLFSTPFVFYYKSFVIG